MKAWILIISMMLPLFSFADDYSDFRGKSTEIVRQLKAQGFANVGQVDLNKLEQEISNTHWQAMNDGFFSGSGEDRMTSVYLVEQKTVIVNTLSLKLIKQDVYPMAALHEALGANGYDDENYQISLPLNQVQKDKSRLELYEKQLNRPLQKIIKNKQYQNKFGRGGTSVGGGGDGSTIEFKNLLLDLAIQKAHDERLSKEETQKRLELILGTDIEPNWNPEAAQNLEMVPSDHGYRIVIPSILWMTYSYVPQTEAQMKGQMVNTVYNQLFGAN